MAEEKKSKPVWGKDKFTEMVKEYGDRIAGISEDVEKQLKEQMENSEEINPFLEKSDKKKVELKKVMEKVLNESSTFSSVIAYDLGLGVITEDEWQDLDDLTALMSEDDDDGSDDITTTDRPDLNEYQLKAIQKAASPYLTKFMEKTGKNLYDAAVSYISKGPGLTDLNIFRGIFDLIGESLSEGFVERIGRLYNADMKFRKAYDTIVNILTKSGENIKTNIDNIVNNIVGNRTESKDTTRQQSAMFGPIEQTTEGGVVLSDTQIDANKLNLFKALVNVICILMSDNYKGLVLKEFKSKHKHSVKAVKELDSFVNFVNTYSKKYSQADFPKIVANYYQKNISSAGIDSIPSLLYMVSSAIAMHSMSGGIRGVSKLINISKTKPANLKETISIDNGKLKVTPGSGNTFNIIDENGNKYILYWDKLTSNDTALNTLKVEMSTGTNTPEENFKELIIKLMENKNNYPEIIRGAR